MSIIYPNADKAFQGVDLAQLLTAHAGALADKSITTQVQLLTMLHCDFEKVLHALLEIQLVNVDLVLADFFADSPNIASAILSTITDHKLNHIGFEICEPLDVVEAMLANWLAQLSLVLARPVTLNRQLRFPASNVFRQRVGAVTEILCLWLNIGEQGVMLELFDIARPIAAVLPSGVHQLKLKQTNSNQAQHRLTMHYLFANDKIWHYSINVATRNMVLELHEAFISLTTEQTHYKLVSPALIQNQYDHSFHTKIIHLTRGLELEFVTRQA
ncbi:conserved hypothetical protein [Gammaproteobacteria bacterium]